MRPKPYPYNGEAVNVFKKLNIDGPHNKGFTSAPRMNLTTELRTLIRDSKRPIRAIAIQAGVDPHTLWRWSKGRTKTIDADMAETVVLSLRKKGGEK